jgi:hypothetical protein
LFYLLLRAEYSLHSDVKMPLNLSDHFCGYFLTGLTGFKGLFFYIQPFRLPAIASRSGEAGGDERLNMQSAFSGNDVAFLWFIGSGMSTCFAEGDGIFSLPSGR